MATATDLNAEASGSFSIGGDLPVHRLGFGAMRLTGKGIWGEPADVEASRATLRRAVEVGITLIDTADSYGPEVSENLIGATLAPYPANMVIATKGGLVRSGPDYCTREGIGFIPWFPLATGALAQSGSVLDQIAQRLQAAPSQVALAWLLHRSPIILPIPGTASVAHLEENVAAAHLTLSEGDMVALAQAVA